MLLWVENVRLVTGIPQKLTSGMHFPRENEGSLKINADSTTLLLAHFNLTRKKWGLFIVDFENRALVRSCATKLASDMSSLALPLQSELSFDDVLSKWQSGAPE